MNPLRLRRPAPVARPTRRRPAGRWRAWGAALLRALGRLVPRRTRPAAPAVADLGPCEAEAVERALARWVRRQARESTPVPARRIDSD